MPGRGRATAVALKDAGRPAAQVKQAAAIAKQAAQIPDSADLKEPFERIREALAETIKAQSSRPA